MAVSASAPALLDTSVIIGGDLPFESDPPTSAAISVITLGELRAGVALARRADMRSGRERRLAAVRAAFMSLPVDEEVAEWFGNVLAVARAERRTAKATDLLIIATAGAYGRVLYTRDKSQARLAEAAGVLATSL